RLEPPGRDALDFLQCDRASKRREQHGRIAVLPRARIEAADNRLDGGDRAAGATDMPDQACSQEGLADVGSSRGDEDSGHLLFCWGKRAKDRRIATRLPPDYRGWNGEP